MHEKEYLQEAIPNLQAHCRPSNGSVKLHKDEDNAIAVILKKMLIAKVLTENEQLLQKSR